MLIGHVDAHVASDSEDQKKLFRVSKTTSFAKSKRILKWQSDLAAIYKRQILFINNI